MKRYLLIILLSFTGILLFAHTPFRAYNNFINYENSKKNPIMNNNETSIEINNAGLSLIFPFFPKLFHELGYLTPDGSGFNSLEYKIRAVFVLRYLSGIADEQSSFERILVNLPSDVLLPSSMELTEKEKQICDNQLREILLRWGNKMRNMPIETFQESFLMRRGALTIQQLRSLIKPERTILDVLLESVPWEFGVISLPWMDREISVEWWH